MKVETVAIIGAGPAGLTAACKLSRRGIKVTVYEAGDSVGGMARTISLWGQMLDLGPHRFFSRDPRVNELWLEAVGRDYSIVNRLTRVYYRNTFFDYPLRVGSALRGLGFVEAIRCILSLIKARVLPERDESTFETWVSNRFGSRLFGIFFRSYSEKLWGISCKELDADFARQRIRKLSLFEAVKSAVIGNRETRHKTLEDEFAYPHFGAGLAYERLAQDITEHGGKIHLNTSVKAVRPPQAPDGKPVVEFDTGAELVFDHVVSTMPISILVDRMGAPDDIRQHARALKFRNTILIYLKVEGPSPFPDQWIYVHSSNLQMGRVTNFQNWVPGITNGQKDTILCLEYWCYDRDEIWARDEVSLVNLATEEIYKTTLVPAGSVKAGKVVRVPKCYPVYATGYRTHLAPIEQYLSAQHGLSVIGRYGAFKYNNQDHSILMGLLAAENIADGAHHNLWAINSDYEYHESSRITSTGLSRA